jgi:hypothetical protein
VTTSSVDEIARHATCAAARTVAVTAHAMSASDPADQAALITDARAAPPYNRAAITLHDHDSALLNRTPTRRNAGFQTNYRQNLPMVERCIA